MFSDRQGRRRCERSTFLSKGQSRWMTPFHEEGQPMQDFERGCAPIGSGRAWPDRAVGVPRIPFGGHLAIQDEFMQRAVELAREGVVQGRGGPFGAVVVKDGVVLGEGWNVLASQDPTCHAEVVAIRDARRRLGSFCLAGCEIYASSEPCLMCLGAIYWSGMGKVCFANGRVIAAPYGLFGRVHLRRTWQAARH